MKRAIVAATALTLVCLPTFAQPQAQTSAAGRGKTFCSGYEAALTIASRTAGQPYQRPPAGCFAVSPDVIVTILQSYPKLPSGGAIAQVQLGSARGFLAFSLAPSTPPVAALGAAPAKATPSQPAPSGPASPATKPSDSTFATASLPPAPLPQVRAGEAQPPTDDVQSPRTQPKTARRYEPMVPIGGGKSAVGDWLVSVEKDRFDGPDQVVAIAAGNNNSVTAVRCLKGESSVALLGTFEAGEVAKIKFRVDNNPVVDTFGSAISATVLQILTTDEMLRQMLDAHECPSRFNGASFLRRRI
jgi:hypothetical protein